MSITLTFLSNSQEWVHALRNKWPRDPLESNSTTPLGKQLTIASAYYFIETGLKTLVGYSITQLACLSIAPVTVGFLVTSVFASVLELILIALKDKGIIDWSDKTIAIVLQTTTLACNLLLFGALYSIGIVNLLALALIVGCILYDASRLIYTITS